jgi:thiol:disulfide interchange protein
MKRYRRRSWTWAFSTILLASGVIVMVFLLAKGSGLFSEEEGIVIDDIRDLVPEEASDEILLQDQTSDSEPVLHTFAGKSLSELVGVYDFNQEDYEYALGREEKFLLYFTANWCMNCQEEINSQLMIGAEQEEQALIFIIHLSDNKTEAFEERLARTYGVDKEGTKIVIQNREVLEQSDQRWAAADYQSALSL